MSKIKKNKGLRGDVLEYVAQASPQFDAEIGQKHHFRMETSSKPGTLDPDLYFYCNDWMPSVKCRSATLLDMTP